MKITGGTGERRNDISRTARQRNETKDTVLQSSNWWINQSKHEVKGKRDFLVLWTPLF